MQPSRVLITEERFADLGDEISKQLDGLEFRFVPRDDVSDDDLAWADTWIGYRAPAPPTESSIRWFHSAADGVDPFHSLYEDFASTGSLLTNTVGTMPHRIAEYVVTMLLGHVRQLPAYAAQERDSVWKHLPVTTSSNMKITIVGTGRIGSEIARKLAPFVAEVRGLSRSGKEVDGFEAVDTFASHKFLDDADAVIAILPMTPDTDQLIDASFFERLDGAVFMNVGRGKTVNEDDLEVAIKDGKVSHAILDVVAKEPMAQDDWRWADDRVTITPHISGQTMASDVVDEFVANYRAIVAGEEPPRKIDLDGWY